MVETIADLIGEVGRLVRANVEKNGIEGQCVAILDLKPQSDIPHTGARMPFTVRNRMIRRSL